MSWLILAVAVVTEICWALEPEMGGDRRHVAGIERPDRPQLRQHGPARAGDARPACRHRLCGLDRARRGRRHHRRHLPVRRPRVRGAGRLHGADRHRHRRHEAVRASLIERKGFGRPWAVKRTFQVWRCCAAVAMSTGPALFSSPEPFALGQFKHRWGLRLPAASLRTGSDQLGRTGKENLCRVAMQQYLDR